MKAFMEDKDLRMLLKVYLLGVAIGSAALIQFGFGIACVVIVIIVHIASPLAVAHLIRKDSQQ